MLAVAAALTALVGGYLFWRYWRGGHPDLLIQEYRNTKFGFSLDYPASWHLGYMGDSEETGNPVWFVSNPQDVQLMEGGLPCEVTVPVVVQELGNFAEIDPSMPEIRSSWDWVNWKRSRWTEADYERLGSFHDSEITIDGKVAVKTVFEAGYQSAPGSADDRSAFGEAGPWIVVVLFDPGSQLVYQIEYVGRQPFYDDNFSRFEGILASFRCAR